MKIKVHFISFSGYHRCLFNEFMTSGQLTLTFLLVKGLDHLKGLSQVIWGPISMPVSAVGTPDGAV